MSQAGRRRWLCYRRCASRKSSTRRDYAYEVGLSGGGCLRTDSSAPVGMTDRGRWEGRLSRSYAFDSHLSFTTGSSRCRQRCGPNHCRHVRPRNLRGHWFARPRRVGDIATIIAQRSDGAGVLRNASMELQKSVRRSRQRRHVSYIPPLAKHEQQSRCHHEEPADRIHYTCHHSHSSVVLI